MYRAAICRFKISDEASEIYSLTSDRHGQMRTLAIILALASSATASSLQKPVLALRGGSYPAPKAGYHALAAKGAASSKQCALKVLAQTPMTFIQCQ